MRRYRSTVRFGEWCARGRREWQGLWRAGTRAHRRRTAGLLLGFSAGVLRVALGIRPTRVSPSTPTEGDEAGRCG